MTQTRTSTASAASDRVSTGVAGIDTVLEGGLIPNRSTLVRGPPGAGKTLFGLHYLTAGIANGETGLFINMGEPEQYLRDDASGFGFDTDSIDFLDLTPEKDDFHADATYDVFAPAEVDGPPIADTIVETVEALDPDRIFIDPMTQLRYLLDDPYTFRKQVMAFLRFLEETSVVFTSQATASAPDDDLQFLADSIFQFDRDDDGRTVTVSKFRGSGYRNGDHSLRITDRGLVVAPALEPDVPTRAVPDETLSIGVPELDSLLHGGLDRGTVTLVSGPTGIGKTTFGLRFLAERANRGDRAVLYSFEESERTLLGRADAVDIAVQESIDRGSLDVVEVDSRRWSAGEFAQRVRRSVESDGTDVVMIDSVDGYQRSLLGADPTVDLVDLGRYLRNVGVTTLFANEVHRVTGEFLVTEEGISQLADSVVFFRYIEYQGELRKVVGVLKKRTGDFEHSLRELRLTENGLEVGDPLPELQGILTGTPSWTDSAGETASKMSDGSHT